MEFALVGYPVGDYRGFSTVPLHLTSHMDSRLVALDFNSL